MDIFDRIKAAATLSRGAVVAHFGDDTTLLVDIDALDANDRVYVFRYVYNTIRDAVMSGDMVEAQAWSLVQLAIERHRRQRR